MPNRCTKFLIVLLGGALSEKLRSLCAGGEDMFSPKMVNLLMEYRDALRPHEDRNPAAAALALQFDQALTRVRDTLCDILIRRYLKRQTRIGREAGRHRPHAGRSGQRGLGRPRKVILTGSKRRGTRRPERQQG